MRLVHLLTVAILAFHAASCSSKTTTPEKLYPVPRDGKWGFIDQTGALVVEPRYDATGIFSEGLAAVRVDNRWGFIDSRGEEVISPRFALVAPFYDGRALISNGMYWGYADTSGEVAIEPRFLVARRFIEGVAVVNEGRLCGLIGTDGKAIGQPRFRDVMEFSEGLAGASVERKWGFIDTTGTMVIEARFDLVWRFSESVAPVSVDDVWGLIDKTGMMVVEPRFDDLRSFSEARAAAKVGEKWGFIDRTGSMVVQPRFEDVWSFSGGKARVRLDGRDAYVDLEGHILPREDDSIRARPGQLEAVRANDTVGYVDSTGAYVWEPTPIPKPETAEAEPEEYAVYSSLLATSDRDPAYVIGTTELSSLETDPYRMFEPRYVLAEVKRELPAVEQSALDDLLLRPECKLKRGSLHAKRGIEVVDKHPGWEVLWSRHRGMPEVVVFSRVGFNTAKTQALLYVGVSRGHLDGSGDYLLLEKIDGAWVVKDSWNVWIS